MAILILFAHLLTRAILCNRLLLCDIQVCKMLCILPLIFCRQLLGKGYTRLCLLAIIPYSKPWYCTYSNTARGHKQNDSLATEVCSIYQGFDFFPCIRSIFYNAMVLFFELVYLAPLWFYIIYLIEMMQCPNLCLL
jgi:hypothetical protein